MKKLILILALSSGIAFTLAATAPVDTQMKSSIGQTELTRRLRAKIMADDQLSTLAHNVNIISTKDAITLKGTVASRAEKVKLENYARSMAGELKVFNQLQYKR